MKPKAPSEHEDGLLEYLEDIIGTSQYKLPIEESLAEMERLVEERAEKLNRLRLVEKEKSALEAKKREAEDFLRLQNEHVRAQSRLWQWYLWKCLVNEEEFANRMVRFSHFPVYFHKEMTAGFPSHSIRPEFRKSSHKKKSKIKTMSSI